MPSATGPTGPSPCVSYMYMLSGETMYVIDPRTLSIADTYSIGFEGYFDRDSGNQRTGVIGIRTPVDPRAIVLWDTGTKQAVGGVPDENYANASYDFVLNRFFVPGQTSGIAAYDAPDHLAGTIGTMSEPRELTVDSCMGALYFYDNAASTVLRMYDTRTLAFIATNTLFGPCTMLRPYRGRLFGYQAGGLEDIRFFDPSNGIGGLAIPGTGVPVTDYAFNPVTNTMIVCRGAEVSVYSASNYELLTTFTPVPGAGLLTLRVDTLENRLFFADGFNPGTLTAVDGNSYMNIGAVTGLPAADSWVYMNSCAVCQCADCVGPTGATGLAGYVIPFSTGTYATPASNAAGQSSSIALAGFGSASTAIPLTSATTFTISVGDGWYPLTMSKNSILRAVYVDFATIAAWTAPTNVTLYVAIATAPSGSNMFTIAPDSITPASEIYQNGVLYPIYTPRSGATAGLNIPISAGTRLAIVLGFTTAGGLPAESLPFVYTGSLYLE